MNNNNNDNNNSNDNDNNYNINSTITNINYNNTNLPPDLDINFLGTNQYYDSDDRCLFEYKNIGKFIESTYNNNNPYYKCRSCI